MTSYADLSGIFHIQRKYLTDLSYQAQDSTNAAQLFIDLQNKLDTAYQSYSAVNPSISKTLTNQTDMKNIITSEYNRLATKKGQVDTALFGQRRMAAFSESYSQKYQAQMKILYVIIIVSLTYLALSVIHSFIPVPDVLFNVITITVGIIGLIIIVMTIRDIRRRYNMDFTKLNLANPVNMMEKSGNGTYDDNFYKPLFCVGEACCPSGNKTGAIWDPLNQQCLSAKTVMGNVAGTKTQGFTTISQLNGANVVAPYAPSEINSYTKI